LYTKYLKVPKRYVFEGGVASSYMACGVSSWKLLLCFLHSVDGHHTGISNSGHFYLMPFHTAKLVSIIVNEFCTFKTVVAIRTLYSEHSTEGFPLLYIHSLFNFHIIIAIQRLSHLLQFYSQSQILGQFSLCHQAQASHTAFTSYPHIPMCLQ